MPRNDDSPNTDIRANLITALQPLLNSLVNAIDKEHTPELLELRNIFLRRLIFSGDVIPSRIPAPNNITEIGGYLNYLQDLKRSEMAINTAASALGVAVPLSEERLALITQRQSESCGSLKKALAMTAAWVAVCNTGHEFWNGNAEASYDAARSDATTHDVSKHGGKTTAALLSL